jgi:hypothetical protein
MLVLGDPERALQDGDARWVRVAIVIEAATLHGDGAVARMGLERAGVFSAKPEILSTAIGLQETLRAQHRFLMEHGPLSNVPEVVAAMNDQHAIDLARHPEALPVLGRALRDMQQERWEGALAGLNLSPCEVSEDAIGARLTDVSRRTGILDLDSLRSLLVSDVGGGRVLWASRQ